MGRFFICVAGPCVETAEFGLNRRVNVGLSCAEGRSPRACRGKAREDKKKKEKERLHISLGLYIMGKHDIRLVPAHKAELSMWWDKLDRTGRGFVESKIGRLLPLMRIEVHGGLVQALAHFWCPETSTFIFVKHELTPTLEEYSIAIGKPLGSELIGPPIGVELASILSDLLRIKESEIRKVLKANRNTCPYSFLHECFKNDTSFQMGKIFLLAFFGFVIFPHCKNAIAPSIAWVVKQVCVGVNYVNTILAETFLSLTRYKENRDRVLHAPSELLQIWFLSHIKGFEILMAIREVTDLDHPILKFEERKKHAPDYHYSEWLAFMKNPDPNSFLWHAKWFQVREARLTCAGIGPVPLLGFTGATEYHPSRVVRQYQVVQELPPALEEDPLRANFTYKDQDEEDMVNLVKSMWDMCPPDKLIWPEEELKGRERKYYSSLKYIKQHKIPKELLPEIPDVPVKVTNRAEIGRLKRKAGRYQERAKKLALANEQLQKKVVSHVYIDQAK